jgi:hypothetical protein
MSSLTSPSTDNEKNTEVKELTFPLSSDDQPLRSVQTQLQALRKDLSALLKESEDLGSDCVFTFNRPSSKELDEPLYAHKAILAARYGKLSERLSESGTAP